MPYVRGCLLSAFLVVGVSWVVAAQEKAQSNAEVDGFKGPIKSVRSTVLPGEVVWGQPDGPTMVTPLWCRDCDYYPDGTRTASGQVVDCVFHGEVIRFVFDARGRVVERFGRDSSTGMLNHHDIVGPFGKTKETFYTNGKVFLEQTYSYDEYGHMKEMRSVDPTGERDALLVIKTDKDGEILERSSYGKNGEPSGQQTFDPETKVDSFTLFDKSELVTLTWTVDHGRLSSFWESQDSPPPKAGDNFTERQDENNYDNYACHPDLKCDLSHVHYEFLNGDHRLPVSVEWRDADDQLQLLSYFDYDLDAFQNWTRRRVWVWNPDLGTIALSETDSRVIIYWNSVTDN